MASGSRMAKMEQHGKKNNLPKVLNTLLPIALVELLQAKGIITQDELNKAMAKVLMEVYSKQRR